MLQESGAIRECEEHGWMQNRTDPHARKRALAEARRDPPASIAPEQAVAEIRDVLDSIGDSCPERSPDAARPPDRGAFPARSGRGQALATPRQADWPTN